MPSFPYTFASEAGNVNANQLDANFAVCAFASDLTALVAVVAALPSAAVPLKPVAAGAAGSAATLSKADHQHPPQSAQPNLQVGTTYTLLPTDDGGVLDMTNAAAIALTFPNNMAVGASGLITQAGAGQITMTAAVGTTLRQADSFTKTRKQWSEVTWHVRANPGGSSAEYVISGDMA